MAGPSSSTSTLAIVAFVLSFVVPIVGLVLGLMAQREIDGSNGKLTGRGLATAAIVINFVAIAGIIIWIMALASVLGATSSFY